MALYDSNWKEHLDYLFRAELQFRLSIDVNSAVVKGLLPTNGQIAFKYGRFTVLRDEIKVPEDLAGGAAVLLETTCTFMMAIAIKEAIESLVPELRNCIAKGRHGMVVQNVQKAIACNTSKPWKVHEDHVASAYHISRLIRNAFVHSPFAPQWKINQEIQDSIFIIPDVIELNTKDLNGKPFDWHNYGGLLALFNLCRYTRFEILGDQRVVYPNNSNLDERYDPQYDHSAIRKIGDNDS